MTILFCAFEGKKHDSQQTRVYVALARYRNHRLSRLVTCDKKLNSCAQIEPEQTSKLNRSSRECPTHRMILAKLQQELEIDCDERSKVDKGPVLGQ